MNSEILWSQKFQIKDYVSVVYNYRNLIALLSKSEQGKQSKYLIKCISNEEKELFLYTLYHVEPDTVNFQSG